MSVAVALGAAPLRAEPLLVHVNVFESGRDGYHTYRIPAIETAADGSLVAFAEARKYNRNDPGFDNQDIDLVCKRSTDNGRTWSAMKIIEDPGEMWSAANPATVLDRQTGRLWLLYLRCRPGRSSRTARPGTDDIQTLARTSDDHGQTWSEPIDLTAVARDMADPEWKVSVVGPGGMIQDRRGRLVAPIWKAAPYGVLAIFSEDHGHTWQRGRAAPGSEAQSGNENQLVELADGRILMDYRQSKGPNRWLTESGDGGRTWSDPRPGVTVSPVACAIERYTLRAAGDDRDRLLWTGPKGPRRSNLVVRISYDEGRTFEQERPLNQGPAAYSDLTILKDKTVGVLWESGVQSAYEFITFTRFNREFLEPAQAAGPSPTVPDLKQGGVVMTFDDRNFDAWLDAMPLMERYGVKATFFVSGAIDAPSLEAVKKLHDRGHAIGVHGVHHLSASDYCQKRSPEQYVTEEVLPQIESLKAANIAPTGFAYPNSRNNAETDAALLKVVRHLRTGTSVASGEPVSGKDAFFVPAGKIAGQGCLYGKGIDDAPNKGDRTYEQIDGALARAAKNGEVLVLYAHSIGTTGRGHHVSPEALEHVFQKAKQLDLKFYRFDDLP